MKYMNNEKNIQEEEQLELNEIESSLPEYKTVEEMDNEEIDEIAPVEENQMNEDFSKGINKDL